MNSRSVTSILSVALLVGASLAQKSVPSDLSSGFASSGVQLQVSYTANAVDGFTDGSTFTQDQVAKEPTFALGDSSSISTSSLFTILMIDTTSDSSRTLHYARANFKFNFDITNIVTTDAALLAYKAPGTLGETGDRKYSFLLYTNPPGTSLKSLKLPAQGQPFDAKQFQSDNGLSGASAGLGMTVKIGSTSSNNAPSNGPLASSASTLQGTPAVRTSSRDSQQAVSTSRVQVAGTTTMFTSAQASATLTADGQTLIPSASAQASDDSGSGAAAGLQTYTMTVLAPNATGSARVSGVGAGSATTSSTAAPALQTGSASRPMAVASWSYGTVASSLLFWYLI